MYRLLAASMTAVGQGREKKQWDTMTISNDQQAALKGEELEPQHTPGFRKQEQ